MSTFRFHFRMVTAAMLVPFMKLTGLRFKRKWRSSDTCLHRAVNYLVNVGQANYWCGVRTLDP